MNKTNISPEEYLKQRIKVWCHNRGEWEIDELTILPKGNFIDRKNRLHRKENHTAYVTLDDALKAVEMAQEILLSDTEAKIDALKSEQKLLESLSTLSECQEEIARSYTPGAPDNTLQSLLYKVSRGSSVTSEELKELLSEMGKKATEGPEFNKATKL